MARRLLHLPGSRRSRPLRSRSSATELDQAVRGLTLKPPTPCQAREENKPFKRSKLSENVKQRIEKIQSMEHIGGEPLKEKSAERMI